MSLIKMGTAARRARMGSTTAISRALRAAGVSLVALSPGVFAVEEDDLNRFLRNRPDESEVKPARTRPKPLARHDPAAASAPRPKKNKRRS